MVTLHTSSLKFVDANSRNSDFLVSVRVPLGVDMAALAERELKLRHWDAGPLLQGMLMESVAPEVAERLHGAPFNPYSQYCERAEDGSLVWVLSALTTEAYELVVRPVLETSKKPEVLRLKRLDLDLSLVEPQETRISRRELAALAYGEAPSTFTLNFLTPTAFKSAGEYQIMPSVRLIFQNLLMHYGQVFEGSNEADVETLDYLMAHTHITRYRLRSQTFALAGKHIPAFMGSLTVRVNGPATLRGFVYMLLRFGEFSGIGIKTSMGMGGFKLT